MNQWQDLLGDLRVPYMRESIAKVDDAESLVRTLQAQPGDELALDLLLRRFHGFAGSGSSYGFPRITELGREGESACVVARREGRPVSPDELAQLRRLLEGIRLELAGQRPSAGAAATPAWKATAQARVLVVDDEPDVLEAVTRVLHQEGYEVTPARTAGEALEQIASSPPDALVIDILLPDGTGYALVEKVRALPGGDAPPILMISILTGLLDKVEAIHCGADGYFEKPVEWDSLLRRLHLLLERNRPQPSRVMSLEDDPEAAAFLRVVLESAGYEFRVCADPRQMEHDLLAYRPDLLLMDVLLPGASGHDLTRYLRQHDVHATMPIVVLTTESQMETRLDTLRAGADDFLIKPVAPGLLLSTVAARIERARFLRSLLERDGLTSLLTHSAFLERARSVVARRLRDPGVRCAWVMLDLDAFKAVNDRHGHPVGDRVLASLSSLLRRRLRRSDTMGRYGGEEFAVLLEDLEEADVVRLVNRLLDEFAEMPHRSPHGETFTAAFSAGVAMLEEPDLDSWRHRADEAMYSAKRAGRRRVVGASTPPSDERG
jgi:diguanylate cyclase (GGDEF)-like protein